MTRMHVYIADDHHHVFPFLVALKKQHLSASMVLLHYDSHPDLSIPSNIDCWRHPRTLWEHLEEIGGIAEFLTPLLYHNHLSSVLWIKPKHCDQFENGEYQFCIGKASVDPDSTISDARCNLRSSYYVDNDSFDDVKNLTDAKPVTFYVQDVDDFSDDQFIRDLESQIWRRSFQAKACWVLDICLDFFTVCNPFLADLTCDQMTIQCIQRAFRGFRYRSYAFLSQFSSEEIRCERQNALNSYNSLLLDFDETRRDLIDSFVGCFDHNEQQHALEFVSLLPSLSCEDRSCLAEIKDLILLPHKPLIDECDPTSWHSILENRINHMCSSIATIFGDTAPVGITIAQSIDDGYTDPNMASTLRDMVINAIQTHLMPLWKLQGVPLEIHESDDEWDSIDKCNSIFMSKKCFEFATNKSPN